MAGIQFSGNSINAYENLKHMYSGVDLAQSFVKGQSTTTSKLWADYASNNMLDSLVSIYANRDKLGGNEAFESLYDNYDYLNSDQRVAAAATELYADRNTLNTYTRYKTDDEGKYIEKSDGTYETEEYEDTEYNYYKENLLKQAAQAKANYEASVQEETDAGLNWFLKGLSTLFSAGVLHTLNGIISYTDNILNLLGGWIPAAYNAATTDATFDEAWREQMSGDIIPTDWIADFDAKYTYLTDDYGNYNTFGEITNSIFESIGMAIPAMVINKLIPGSGMASKIAHTVVSASYWVAMGVGSLKDYFNDSGLDDVATWKLIGMAAVTTTMEALITRGMNVIFGGSAVDKLLFGSSTNGIIASKALKVSGKSAAFQTVKRVFTQAMKEGMEEVLQEYSTAFINGLAENMDEDFATYSQFTTKQMIQAFAMGAISTIITEGVNVTFNGVTGIDSDEVKTDKDGNIKTNRKGNPIYKKFNYATSMNIKEAFSSLQNKVDEINKFIKKSDVDMDESTRSRLVAQAAELTNMMTALGQFYGANEADMDAIAKIINDISNIEKSDKIVSKTTYSSKNVPSQVVSDYNSYMTTDYGSLKVVRSHNSVMVYNSDGTATSYTKTKNGGYVVTELPNYRAKSSELLAQLGVLQSKYYAKGLTKALEAMVKARTTQAELITRDNVTEDITNLQSEDISEDERKQMSDTINELLNLMPTVNSIVVTNGDVGNEAHAGDTIVAGKNDLLNRTVQQIVQDMFGNDLYNYLPQYTKIKQALEDILDTYKTVKNDQNASMEEMLAALMNNEDNFTFTALVKNNVMVFRFITSLYDIAENVSVLNEDLSDAEKAIYKESLNKIQKNISIPVTEYLKLNTNVNYTDVKLLSQEQKDDITRERTITKRLNDFVQFNGKGVQSFNQAYFKPVIDYLRRLVNACTLNEQKKNEYYKLIDDVENNTKESHSKNASFERQAMVLTLEKQFKYTTNSMYDGTYYLPINNVNNVIVNNFLQANDMSLEDIVSGYEYVSNNGLPDDLKRSFIETYNSDYRLRTAFSNRTGVYKIENVNLDNYAKEIYLSSYEYDMYNYSNERFWPSIQIDKDKITVDFNAGSTDYVNNMTDIDTINSDMNDTGTYLTSLVTDNIFSGIIDDAIPISVRSSITVNDIILSPEILSPSVRENIANNYNNNVYSYIIDLLSSYNNANNMALSLVQTDTGEYAISNTAYLNELTKKDTLTDADTKSIYNDYKIPELLKEAENSQKNKNSDYVGTSQGIPIDKFIDSKFLVGPLRDIKVYIKFVSDVESKADYNPNDNSINIYYKADLNVANVYTDASRLFTQEFFISIAHEFCHAVQNYNHIAGGNNASIISYLKKNVISSQQQFVDDLVNQLKDIYDRLLANNNQVSTSTNFNANYFLYILTSGEMYSRAINTYDVGESLGAVISYEGKTCTIVLPNGWSKTFALNTSYAGTTSANIDTNNDGYPSIAPIDRVSANIPLNNSKRTVVGEDGKGITTPEGETWYSTGRYININNVQGTNLKYYLYKNGIISQENMIRDKNGKSVPVQMDPKLQRFIVGADLSKLDVDLREAIVNGKLTYSHNNEGELSILQYIHDADSINDYTFNLIKETIFPDCKVKDFKTLSEYTDDINAAAYYATLVTLKYELKGDMSTIVDLAERSNNNPYAVLSMVYKTLIANPKFKDIVTKHQETFNVVSGKYDISTNYDSGDLRMLLMRNFTGDAQSLLSQLTMERWLMSHNYGSKRANHQNTVSMDRETKIDSHKDSSGDSSLYDTIADESTVNMENDILDTLSEKTVDEMIHDYCIQLWTKRVTQGKYKTREQATKSLNSAINKLTERVSSGQMSIDELKSLYYGEELAKLKVLNTETVNKIENGELKIISNDVKDAPTSIVNVRTDKNIRDNIRNKVNRTIGTRINAQNVDTFKSMFPNIPLTVKVKEDGTATYTLDTKVFVGKTTEQLNALELEVNNAAEYMKIEESKNSMLKREYNKIKRRLEKSQQQVQELQDKLKEGRKSTTIVFDSSTKDFKYEFSVSSNIVMPQALYDILNTQLSDIEFATRDVKNISTGDEQSVVQSTEKIFDAISDKLSNLTEQDISDIISYYGESIMLSVNLSSSQNADALKRYWAIETIVLTYLLDNYRKANINLTTEQVEMATNTIENLETMAGSMLATWRSALHALDPVKQVTERIAKSIKLDVNETAISELVGAINLDVGEVYTGTELQRLVGNSAQGTGVNVDFEGKTLKQMRDEMLAKNKAEQDRLMESMANADDKARVKAAKDLKTLTDTQHELESLPDDKVRDRYLVYMGINKSEIALTSEQKQKIINNAIKAIEKEVLKGYDSLSKKGKTTVWEKLVDWERMMMLSSPGTWVRNAVSNEVVKWTNKAGAAIGSVFEKTFLRKTYARNNELLMENSIETIKALDEDIENIRKQYQEVARKLKLDEFKNDTELQAQYNSLKLEYNEAKEHKKKIMAMKQYKIVGTKVSTEMTAAVNDLFDGSFYTYTDKNGKQKSVSFYDMIADGLSRYSDRTYNPLSKTGKENVASEQIVELIVNNFTAKVFNDNRFTSKSDKKLLKKIGDFENIINKGLFKILSDDMWIKNRTQELYSKMMTELQMSTNDLYSRASMQVFSDAYVYAAWEYMHRTNFWTKADQFIHERTKSGYFLYKQIMPFVSASWNWFMESLNYTPIGLAKGVHQLLTLEKNLDKFANQKVYGGEGISSNFALYTAYKNVGKGVIGTVLMGIGAALAAAGVMVFDEDDDDTIKLKFGDNVYIDVTNLFGTSGLLLGAATAAGIMDAISDGMSVNKVWNILDQMATSLLQDSILNTIFQSMSYSDNIGQWFLDQLVDSLGKFVPNAWKTIASVSNAGVVTKYESGVVGSLEYIALQIVPGLAYALPKKYDVWTGELETEYKYPHLITLFNKLSPIDLAVYDYSEMEKLAKSLGLSKSYLTGNYEDIGKLTTKQQEYLNQMYGQLNNQLLAEFVNGKTKYKVQNENGTYSTLSYSQMTDSQKKSVINRIMTNNASYAKIYVYTNYMGGKYYATDSEYTILKKLGIKINVYKETSKLTGFV